MSTIRESRRRAALVNFRVTDDERSDIQAAAARADLSAGTFVRRAVFAAIVDQDARHGAAVEPAGS